MCGIAGLLSFEAPAKGPAFSLAIRKMAGLMSRRGPDDEGHWSDPDNRMYFGFRRLSILDLSAAGHQPMLSGSGRSALIFNGEIYNFKEIKHELEQKGVFFRSQTDTEVLLEALEMWGESALSKLNGMFAFAWYHKPSKKLVLARDHAGIKPLYYFIHPEGRGFAFASQLNVLLHTPWGAPGPIDLSVLHLYLKLQYVPAPYGFYKNTFQLEPGHYLIITPDKKIENKIWWSLPRNPEPELSGPKAVEKVERSLYNAVQRQKIADVPLGVFLSGGIDSPLVAATLQKQSNEKIKAFTVSNPGWEQDETSDATSYAEQIGLDHYLQNISSEETAGLLAEVAQAQYEPFADFSIIPSLLVSRFAKNKVTVALSGDGGDEIFFGYERPFSLLKDGRMFALPYFLRVMAYGLGKYGLGSKRSGAILSKTAGDYYFDVNTRFKERFIRRIFPGLPPIPVNFRLYEKGPYKNEKDLADYSRYVEYYGQMQRCLKKVDMASMRYGLEVRVPFLDREVIETSIRLDPMEFIASGNRKIVLRKLLSKHVDETSISKSKRGFSVPLKKWMKAGLKSVFEETFFGDSLDLFPYDVKRLKALWNSPEFESQDLKWVFWSIYALRVFCK